MSWKVNYSSQALKFIQKNPSRSEGLKECLRFFIKRLNGEMVPLDIKKMRGSWKETVRIRKGDIRIVLSVDEGSKTIQIRVIDFRGDVYK
jgi:mRNA-degrading endonuclease RelE of RelBE toxin-antitoxin system